jgi:Adenylate kinase./Adenylate kinase, active site lid.
MSCGNCGAIYNVHFQPTKVKGVCDVCQSKDLQSRKDDNETTIKKRVETYREETQPLVTYFKAQGKLRTVKGTDDVDVILKKICNIIDVETDPLGAVAEIKNPSDSKTIGAISGGQVVKKVVKNPVNSKKSAARLKAIKEAAKKTATKPEDKTIAKKSTKKASDKTTDKKTTAKKAAKKTCQKKLPRRLLRKLQRKKQ